MKRYLALLLLVLPLYSQAVTQYFQASSYKFGSASILTSTEIGYLLGASSNLQTQINGKQGTLTNSAGLASALSDETGTGLAVFSASPTFTGSPIVPTQSASDNSTKIASTAYAETAASGAVATHAAVTATHGATGAVVGTTNSQTLTNKTIAAISNTITTAASGAITATELNAAIAQIASLLSASSGVPAGTMMPFAGASAPTGYLICDGRAVSRTTYADLYAAISGNHGIGDGSTTFNIPDMRGAFARGRMDVTTVSGSGSVSSNNATFTSHGINRTGFKVRLTSGTLTGLATGTDYYVIVVDDNTLAFSTSITNANAGTKIAISGTNSAVITQYEDPDYASRYANNGGSSSNTVGARQEDSFQGHYHQLSGNMNTADGAAAPASFLQATSAGGTTSSSTLNNTNYVNVARSDGTNGTTRTSNETRPKNILVNYIIKY